MSYLDTGSDLYNDLRPICGFSSEEQGFLPVIEISQKEKKV